MLQIIAAILLMTAHVQSYSTGAPTEACNDMLPQHEVDPQTGEVPYTLEAIADVECPSGGTCYQVTLSGASFRGFFLQARNIGDEPPSSDQEPEGAWEIPDASTTKMRPCGAADNGVTHVSGDPKDSVTVFFNPGEAALDGLQIVATVVEVKETFWAGIRVPLS